jgi:nucleoside-diphosphate-sugar epimerase
MYSNTVEGTRNLLEAASKENNISRFVHISSFAVYGIADIEAGSVLYENGIFEKNPKERNDSYAKTKLEQKRLVWDYKENKNLPAVVVRPGVVYVPVGDEIFRRIVLSFLGIFVNIGKNNKLPLSYIDNCTEAI